MCLASEGVSRKLTKEAEGVVGLRRGAWCKEGRRLRLRVRVLVQLALLPERPRPAKIVEGAVRELARRRRAAVGTGARTNVDAMKIDGVGVGVAGVIAILIEDYMRRCM